MLAPVAAVCLIGCRHAVDGPIPLDPPPKWCLTTRIYGTLPPSKYDHVVMVQGGQTSGCISARLPQFKVRSDTPVFKIPELSHAQTRAIYRLARSAMQSHVLGKKPETPTCDGASLAIRLDVLDRGIEVTYYAHAILEPEARSLLDALNAHLIKEYRIDWKSWPDMK